MKYVLLFASRTDDEDRFENLSEAERGAMYDRIGKWAERYESKRVLGEQLQPPETATTIRFPGGFKRSAHPLVTDGPFIEGKEIIGGFWVIDVDNLDEALKMAKEWPASTMVEVRPIVERQA